MRQFIKTKLISLTTPLLLTACQGQIFSNTMSISPEAGSLVNGFNNSSSSSFGVILKIKNNSGFARCSGSVIGKRLILTAAHCFEDTTPNSTITVYQSYNALMRWEVIPIGRLQNWKIHESYKPEQISPFDLAVGILDKNIPEDMKPIDLAPSNWILSKNSRFSFVGGGSKNPVYQADYTTPSIQEGEFIGETEVKEDSSVSRIFSFFNSSKILPGKYLKLSTYDDSTTYVCHGDSGGALIERTSPQNQKIVGVLVATSHRMIEGVESCTGEYITVIPVSAHFGWIWDTALKLQKQN